jgi:hypothetical protein
MACLERSSITFPIRGAPQPTRSSLNQGAARNPQWVASTSIPRYSYVCLVTFVVTFWS